MVPSGTPKEIVAKINTELGTIMAAPEMKARVVEQGFLPVTMSVAENPQGRGRLAGETAHRLRKAPRPARRQS